MPSIADLISCPDKVYVGAGKTFTVEYTLQNVGDEGDDFTVELIDHQGNVQDSTTIWLNAGDTYTGTLTGTAPSDLGTFTYYIKATPVSYPENYDQCSFQVITGETRTYESKFSISEEVTVITYTPKVYECEFSITEEVDVKSEPPRVYESKFSITEEVTVIIGKPRTYESKFSISEEVTVIIGEPRVYETSPSITEEPTILAEPPRVYESIFTITEEATIISETPRDYRVELTTIDKVSAFYTRLETQFLISEEVTVTIEKYFTVRLTPQDVLYLIIEKKPEIHLDELESIINKMKYKKSGEIIMPEEWNLVIKALKKQAEINESLLT